MNNKQAQALIIGFQMSLCGLICFVISQYYQFNQGFWSVVTIAAITRPSFANTFAKAGLRLIGTLLGAGLGFLMAKWIGDYPFYLFSFFLVFSTTTIYVGLQTKPYDYLSVVAGFSVAIVLGSFFLDNSWDMALYRTIEVCFGILVMTIVSWIMSKFISSQANLMDKGTPKKVIQVYRSIHFSKIDLIHALIISLTISITFLFWIGLRYPQGIWLTITLFALMEDTLKATQEKAWLKLIGQLFAALLGGVIAIFFPNNLVLIGLVLTLGFYIAGAIIGYESKFSAFGNHAGIALAIMLLAGLPDNNTAVVIHRFLNVVAGIIIAMLVSYVAFKDKAK